MDVLHIRQFWYNRTNLMDNLELRNIIEAHCIKISSSVHAVTEIAAPVEPIRVFLRNEVVKLLSELMSFLQSPAIIASSLKFSIKDSSCRLRVGLTILRDTKLISRTTFRILDDELSTLWSEVEKLSPDDSVVPMDIHSVEGMPPIINLESHNLRSGNRERRERIIELLRESGPSSVTDLARNIQGCSEKTIQRELVAMVSLGLLKKTGERRWSRYSLFNMLTKIIHP